MTLLTGIGARAHSIAVSVVSVHVRVFECQRVDVRQGVLHIEVISIYFPALHVRPQEAPIRLGVSLAMGRLITVCSVVVGVKLSTAVGREARVRNCPGQGH